MNRSVGLLAIVGVFCAIGCSSLASPIERDTGRAALLAAFDPERIFEGELVSNTDDQLILTAWASARDDYAPAYSLAIAYRCIGQPECGYTARILRTGATIDDRIHHSLQLLGQSRTADDAEEMNSILDNAGLQWLEADVEACPNGIFAMDSVRVADWRPDVHYALLPVKDRELILHPAAIRVRMSGTYSTSTYEGWVGADGVPAAVRKLTETLEPCWKPATARLPWRRK